MATVIPDYQIASGHNQAGSLTLITSLTDANSVPFVMPKGKGSRTRGELRFRLDGSAGRVGKDGYSLTSTIMTIDQYKLLLDSYEGLVTVRIPLTSTSFANYNATLWFDDEDSLSYIPNVTGISNRTGFTGACYQDVIWHLNNLVVI